MSNAGKGSLCILAIGVLSTGLPWRVCRAAELDLYGVAHLSYEGIDTGVSSSDYVHSNSSRLGIKGDQDLDYGLSVYVQYESGVDLTAHGTGDGNGGATSAGQIFTRARDAFAGLKSDDYGSIQFGRVGGMNQWLYDYNIFADQVGDLGNVWGGDGLPGRVDDAVEYLSPTLSGFRLALTYVPNEGGHNQHDEVVKADYALGGLKLGAAYAQFGTGSVGLPSLDAVAATASYELDFFNVGGEFQRERNIGARPGAERNQATFGASVKLGKSVTLKAQYTWSGELTGVTASGARQIAAGLDYNLASTTIVYIAYAHTNNAANNSYSSFSYGHGDQGVPTILDGKSPTAYSIGLIYKFDAVLSRNRAGVDQAAARW
ncbi:MAG TPA: porin [Steroidobacteraceae bacterium]|nr:porin [Steroidobacteraceae bacterium]